MKGEIFGKKYGEKMGVGENKVREKKSIWEKESKIDKETNKLNKNKWKEQTLKQNIKTSDGEKAGIYETGGEELYLGKVNVTKNGNLKTVESNIGKRKNELEKGKMGDEGINRGGESKGEGNKENGGMKCLDRGKNVKVVGEKRNGRKGEGD